MHVPAKQLCDLCKNEIRNGQPNANLSIPLRRDERMRMLTEFEKHVQSPGGSLIPVGFIAEKMTPNAWVFAICMGCIEGVLPMLVDLKNSQIENLIKMHVEARENRASFDTEFIQ